jgi:hypothetical protein
MDQNQGAEIQRGLGRVEAALKGLQDWQTGHDAGDTREFAEIRRSFADQVQRLLTLESIADSIEAQGASIAEIEARVTQVEEREKIHKATSERDSAWVKWIFFIVAAIAANQFAPKLIGLIGAMVK